MARAQVQFFFFSSRRRHTRLQGDWSSDVCSSDLPKTTPPSGMTRTTGIAIGTGITPTSITTACLSLLAVPGGDSTRGITILATLPATRTTMTTVNLMTITLETQIVTTTRIHPTIMTSQAMLVHSNLGPTLR